MSRYKWIENLDTTMYTSVDIVEDQATGKQYVSKKVSKLAKPLRIHQFKVEVNILSTLCHPYIPELIDVYEDSESFTLIETYIPGKTLKKRISSRQAIECMDLLHAVHSIGYLYIDIKPSNFLVYKKHVYLIDFNACIEKDAKQAVLASKDFDFKQENPDIRALYTMMAGSRWKGLCYFICFHPRIKSMMQVKRRYKILRAIQRILVCVSVLILSVFFYMQTIFVYATPFEQYLQSPSIDSFTKAYMYTQSQKEGTVQETSQANLYDWIENEWIDPNLFIQKQSAQFLVNEAIQAQNPSLNQYIWKQIPNHTKHQLTPMSQILESCISDTTLNQASVDELLNIISKHPKKYTNEIILLLDTWMMKQYLVNANQAKRFASLQNSMIDDMSESYACEYLEYNLLLHSYKKDMMPIPTKMIQKFENHEKWNALYTFWRQIE